MKNYLINGILLILFIASLPMIPGAWLIIKACLFAWIYLAVTIVFWAFMMYCLCAMAAYSDAMSGILHEEGQI
jgi:hypothetical protein